MALDRNKVTRNAERLVARGKLNAAIDEYRKLLADSPNDTGTLNRVGDLYARLNRLDQATALFQKTAEHFIDEGFFVKAIAIYKKIIRLDPTQIAAYESLADLYSRQGLTGESLAQYQVVADYYQKHDRVQSTIAVYKKMVELDPDDPGVRLRLAELLRRNDRPQEAVGQYREIASQLLAHGRVDDATKVYVTALDTDTDDLSFLTDALLELKANGHGSAAERLLSAATERNPEARGLAKLLGVEERPQRAAVEEPPAAEPEPQRPGAEPAPQPAAEPPVAEPTDDATSAVEGEDILVLDLDDEELSADLSPGGLEILGTPQETRLAEAAPPAAEEEFEIDLAGFEAGAGEVDTEAVDRAERLGELLDEAETLSRFGLVEKAAQRLQEVLELDPLQAHAYDSLISLYLDLERPQKIVALAAALSEMAAEGQIVEVWQATRDRLLAEGFRIEGGVIEAPAVEAVGGEAGVAAGVAAEAAGAREAPAEWLEERSATGSADESDLFRDEEEFFDLASELEEELLREERASGLAPIEPLDEESVEEIVEGFKKGMAESLSAEDYDTHYNLGIAYREMGLVDEAIGEFQLAAKDARYLVDCCSLLAASFIDKGFPELAVKWYLRGLASPTLSEDESLGLLYELGNLHMSMGDEAAARERFVEIYGANSNYRDVVAKLEELGGAAGVN